MYFTLKPGDKLKIVYKENFRYKGIVAGNVNTPNFFHSLNPQNEVIGGAAALSGGPDNLIIEDKYIPRTMREVKVWGTSPTHRDEPGQDSDAQRSGQRTHLETRAKIFVPIFLYFIICCTLFLASDKRVISSLSPLFEVILPEHFIWYLNNMYLLNNRASNFSGHFCFYELTDAALLWVSLRGRYSQLQAWKCYAYNYWNPWVESPYIPDSLSALTKPCDLAYVDWWPLSVPLF